MPSSSSVGDKEASRRHARRSKRLGHGPKDDVISSLVFLLQMSQNFEEQDNFTESVKSAESALLLRKAREGQLAQAGGEEALTALGLHAHISDQAKDLVLRCHSYAVSEFNNQRVDTALFFLKKALFLTDNGVDRTAADVTRTVVRMMADDVETTRILAVEAMGDGSPSLASYCFAHAEEDRLRLRASTFNNLGCMERRQGHLKESLQYLCKAVQIEIRLDPSGMGSASTYLNLCTVLNELNRHREAVVAAERAIESLQLTMVEERDAERLSTFAMMLAVGWYNLGVSLERRGQAGDAQAAQTAYQSSLDTARHYLIEGDCPTVEAALSAIRRMKEPSLRADVFRTSNKEQQQGTSLDSTPSKMSPQLHSTDDQRPLPPATAAPHTSRLPPLQSPALHSDSSTPSVFSDRSSLFSANLGKQGFLNSRYSYPDKKAERPIASSTMNFKNPVEAATGGVYATAPPGSHSTGQRQSSSGTHQYDSVVRVQGQHGFATRPADHASLSHLLCPSDGEGQLAAAGGWRDDKPSAPSLPTGLFHYPMQRPTTSSPCLPPTAPRMGSGLLRLPCRDSIPHHQTAAGFSDTPFGSSIQEGGPLLSFGSPLYHSRPSLTPNGPSGKFDNAPPSFSSIASRPSVAAPPPFLVASSAESSFATHTGHRHSLRGSLVATKRSNPFGRRMFGSIGGGSHSTVAGTSSAVIDPSSGSVSRASRGGQLDLRDRTAMRKKSLRDKQLNVARKRQHREAVEKDAALADAVYQQMVVGMKENELRRCRRAAVLIQRMWRGVIARAWIRTMMRAAVRIQLVTRRFLVKVREEHRLLEEKRARERLEQEKRELSACRTLQARMRLFLRRLQIRREYLALVARKYYAARTIQRGYRGFCQRRTDYIASVAEAHRREDERRLFREKVAARRIQAAFLMHKERTTEMAATQEKQRRQRAATKIQAHVRGMLARAWFRYYRDYRRNKELHSAATHRRLVIIQTACRGLLSLRYRTQRQVEIVMAQYQKRLDDAAVRIQGMWRCHVARIRLERLRAERARLDGRASFIQRWYRMCVLRKEFIAIREARRRAKAARRIQKWLRNCRHLEKERAFAAYHAELLHQQQTERLRATSLLVLQAWLRSHLSELLVASMRQTYIRNTTVAVALQRMARGYGARVDLSLERACAWKTAQAEFERVRQTAAVLVLQRAWRCAAAKDKVERIRRAVAAATTIARSYRVYRAKMALNALKEARQRTTEDTSARIIQRQMRCFLKQRELARMHAYYNGHHKKKMLALRREEAAITIQSMWRGCVTRRAVQREKDHLRYLGAFATTIQRAWRGTRSAACLKTELANRAVVRNFDRRAALTIQCFWRKMMAAERVARLRDANQHRLRSAYRIQSWWRLVIARRELARRRKQREEEDAAVAFYTATWERAATRINAFARSRLSQMYGVAQKELHLRCQLSVEEQDRFKRRHAAATRIQSVYRGLYARVYARGLHREHRELEKRRAERAERERVAAVRIQCVYRRHLAKMILRRRRVEKRARILEDHEEYLVTVNPGAIVRELFWAHEALLQRNFSVERYQRVAHQDTAAQRIQRCFHSWIARKTAQQRADELRREAAAKLIQAHWIHRCRQMREGQLQRCQMAAIRIQARVRGWLVRRDWAGWRTSLARQRYLHVQTEDMLDHGATVLQSFWRRILAQRRAAALRKERALAKDSLTQSEAAMVIQIAFRAHLRSREAMT